MLDKDYVGLDQRETIFLPIAHENNSLPQPCSDAILALLVTFAVLAETVLITQLPPFECKISLGGGGKFKLNSRILLNLD